MLARQTLKRKIVFASALVSSVVALVVGVVFYVTQVKPVEEKVMSQLYQQAESFIHHKIDMKIQAGITGATMLTLQPAVIDALTSHQYEPLKPTLQTILDGYAQKSNFKGIFAQVIDAQGQVPLQSWKLDSPGKSLAQDALFKQVVANKSVAGSLLFGERGVTVVAYSPVLDANKQLLGMVSFIQGVGSISRDYSAEFNGAWVMLVDKQYVAQKFGSTAAADKLNAVNERYVLANNKWFAEEVVALTKQVYQAPVNETRQAYLSHGKLVIDLPAVDETGKVFGRQVFIQDERVLTEPLALASQQAWQALVSVVLALLVLVVLLVLLVNRLVVSPLQGLTNTLKRLEATDDFSLSVNLQSQDEVGQMAEALNRHLVRVSQAIHEANEAISALSRGELSQRITGDYKGDLLVLKDGVNASADVVQAMIGQVAQAMDALNRGDFAVQINQLGQGAFAQILADVAQSMTRLNHIIHQTNQVMRAVAQGEFDERIEVESQGSLAQLKSDINNTLTQLSQTIDDISRVMQLQSQGDLRARVQTECQGSLQQLKHAINANADHLAKTIRQVSASASMVATAADEVSMGSMSLSDSVQEQAASMEETSATMIEINAAIRDNANNSVRVDDLEHRLQKQSESAAQVMQQTIEAMSEIQASSQQITEIVTLIDGIAFQTNLLALNAAVEAARAGEHGRGFAVVAGEVRALAQKSSNAAQEIRALIAQSVNSIEQGTQLAKDSQQVLIEMNGSIDQVTNMIAEIASASAGQATGVSEINKALQLMDQVTQQNAALVEQTAAASQSLKEQAAVLDEYMGFFKA